MEAGDVTLDPTGVYEYLQKLVRVLSSGNTQLHLKLFFQKDVQRQENAMIDALRQEVAEVKKTVKDLQEKNERVESVHLEEKCKRQDLEEKVGFVTGQKDDMQSLNDENAELNEKLRSQIELAERFQNL